MSRSALRWGGPLVIAVIVLGLWYLITERGMVSTLIVPRPISVAKSAWHGYIVSGLWWNDVWITVYATIKAFVAGLIVGVVTAIIFVFVRGLRMAFYPYILALYAFPSVAIAPLLVTALGYGQTPRVVIGAALVYFPILTATQAGLTEVDKDQLKLLRSLRASKLQELRYLRVPNAMSYLFPSLDFAVIVALLGVIVGEFVGSRAGLGYLIEARTTFGDTASVYAVLFTLAVIGILMRSIMIVIRKVLPREVVPR
jgi:NitT/TauT family transport system permease protein